MAMREFEGPLVRATRCFCGFDKSICTWESTACGGWRDFKVLVVECAVTTSPIRGLSSRSSSASTDPLCQALCVPILLLRILLNRVVCVTSAVREVT